jgi:cellulose biosynthesis protein BcsQ
MIISLLQTKGGVGKSTLALLLAYSPVIRKKYPKVSVLDLDAQGTIKAWVRERKGRVGEDIGIKFDSYIGEKNNDFAKVVKSLYSQKKDELLIIDSGGDSVLSFGTSKSLSIPDKVIIPLRLTTNDEEAFAHNLNPTIEKDQTKNKFFLLPSFIHTSANVGNIMDETKTRIVGKNKHLQVMKSPYYYRSIFQNFCRYGLSLPEYKSLYKTNKKETERVIKAEQDVAKISKEIIRS